MKYAKAWVSAVGSIATALTAAFSDNVLDHNEAASVASVVVIAVLSVWGVYRTPNKVV